jgi:hypothetical protein
MNEREREVADLFTFMGTEDYRARAAAVQQTLAEDPDALSVEETSTALGLPPNFLIVCAAAYLALCSGHVVTIGPTGETTRVLN